MHGKLSEGVSLPGGSEEWACDWKPVQICESAGKILSGYRTWQMLSCPTDKQLNPCRSKQGRLVITWEIPQLHEASSKCLNVQLMNVKQEGGGGGGLLKHQQNLPRINKGFKKLTHKFKDINYEAEPQQSQELYKCIHWLTLFCNFLLFCVCVCYNKRYSPRLSICMKISALVQECTFRLCRTAWHSFYASQLFLFPWSISTPRRSSARWVCSVGEVMTSLEG